MNYFQNAIVKSMHGKDVSSRKKAVALKGIKWKYVCLDGIIITNRGYGNERNVFRK